MGLVSHGIQVQPLPALRLGRGFGPPDRRPRFARVPRDVPMALRVCPWLIGHQQHMRPCLWPRTCARRHMGGSRPFDVLWPRACAWHHMGGFRPCGWPSDAYGQGLAHDSKWAVSAHLTSYGQGRVYGTTWAVSAHVTGPGRRLSGSGNVVSEAQAAKPREGGNCAGHRYMVSGTHPTEAPCCR